MFGAIASCTDPVTVSQLLKDLGATKKIVALLEGESLINIAAGMILYELGSVQFYDFIKKYNLIYNNLFSK